jgi:DDB1- and CUL4-associated factor 7
MLATGADDSLVLLWDLINQGTGGVNGAAGSTAPGQTSSSDNGRAPAASWRCDYEVGNLSWAPPSALTSQGGDWLGVSGGRGIWGVKI